MKIGRTPVRLDGPIAFFAVFFAFLFALIPPYLDIRVHENIGLNAQRIIISVTVIWVLASLFLSSSLRNHVKFVITQNGFIFSLVALYIAFRLISLVNNPSVYGGFIFINEMLMNFFVLFLFAIALNSLQRIRYFFVLSVLGAAFVSSFVLLEASLGTNVFADFADLSTAAGQIAAEAKYRDGYYRSQGTFEHPLALAQYLLLVTPMLLSRMIVNRRRFVLVVFAALYFSAAYLSLTRTFYAVMFFGLAFYLFVRFVSASTLGLTQNSKLFILFLVSPVLVSFLAYQTYGFAFLGSSAELSSTSTRLDQIQNGLIATADRPFFGHGIGTAKYVVTDIGLHHPDGAILWNETIDNFYLGVALDSGLLALFFYLLIFVFATFSGISIFRNRCRPPLMRFAAISLSTSIFCGFVSMAVLSIFTVLPLAFALIGSICALSSLSSAKTLEIGKLKNQ